MNSEEATLESVIHFLNRTLGVSGFPDYSGAMNGLQVEAPGPVRHVAVAVDASTQTIAAAVDSGADLLVVHHGIFWGGAGAITGRTYRRIAPLVRADTALYAVHLPLDAHPDLGNCALLMRALGLEPDGRFGRYQDADIGFWATTDLDREELRERVSEVVGGPVQLLAGGPQRVARIGIVTGGGGSFVQEAAEAGLDALVTGEGSHHTYVDATELGVNVLYAGHYATETYGVRALGAALEARFGLPWQFLDFPSGM